MNPYSFKILHKSKECQGRAGVISTPRGEIPTPVFMPVGTQATVKGLENRNLLELDASIILGNTYHLYIRPGTDIIGAAGGLQKFMNWKRPMLTDSGGFQVFSLSKLRKLDPDGVTFRSHLDGREHRFTPEKVIDIQNIFGNDIIMPLDECLAYPAHRKEAEISLSITHDWANRSFLHHKRKDQWLFGIIQGGMFEDLREKSAKFMADQGFTGFSIGGLSVGEPKELMMKMVEASVPHIPEESPRYLMGVGKPEDFFYCIERGIDMFDCVLPTRIGRNASLLTHKGKINIRNAKFAKDFSSPDPLCSCYVCQNHTLAYLRHLFITGEMLGPILAAYHNVHFSLNIVRKIREALMENRYQQLRDEFFSTYVPWGASQL